jgi:phage-related protein (TIGR01555 family)
MQANKPRMRVPAVSDGLENVVANLGTSKDQRTHNTFAFGTWNFVELEAAYAENWIAKQVVNVPVDDGVREWRTWNHDKAGDIEKEEGRLDLKNKFKEGKYWARLYGGAVMLMVTDQPLDEPLDVERINKGGLKRLVVLDRWDISPTQWNFSNPLDENYLLPEYYTVVGGQTQIHHSHVIRLDGEILPRRTRAWNNGWGDSTLRKVFDDVKDVVATKGGIASLVLQANVDVIKRPGLSDELASGEDANILKRYALARQMKSLVNGMLLDGDEDYIRNTLSFSGLSQIMEQFMVWMSGAADIPMTRLFGRSAAGLSATGEGDLNNYYDNVRAEQTGRYSSELEKLDQVLVRSAIGQYPEDINYDWNPLYQESDNEKAQRTLARAQSEDIYKNMGVLLPSQVASRLKAEGEYAIDDDHIERLQQQEQDEENGRFDPRPDETDPFAAAGGAESGADEEEEGGEGGRPGED